MPLYFNGAHIAPSKAPVFNGTRLRRIVCNGVQVWLANVTLKNLVTDADELDLAWSDVGYATLEKKVKEWHGQAGRRYYVRTNFTYFAYAGGAGWSALAQMRADSKVLATAQGERMPSQPPTIGHAVVQGTEDALALRLLLERYDSPQGAVSTKQSMVVDVTDMHITSPDEIWEKIGFFRGSKTVQF